MSEILDTAVAESSPGLCEDVKGMSSAVIRNLADNLRQRIERGEFSPEGAKRATALANRLVPK